MLQSKYVKQCTESNDFVRAIDKNNLPNVKWIYQCQGDELKDLSGPFHVAAGYGTLSIMKWLKEKEFPWGYSTFAAAVEHGNLSNMKWLKAKGCPWENTFQDLYFEGPVEKWLLNHSMITE